MIALQPAGAEIENLLQLWERLGRVPMERIRCRPAPGTASESDLLAAWDEKRLCELVDGVLVDKPMGYYESRLALILGKLIEEYLDTHDLGITLGADGPVRLVPGRVRAPDLSFLSWRHFPDRKLPRKRVLDCVPDLVVEVLSESNTAAEMDRKLAEYFAAGVRLAWLVDPETCSVRVYAAPEESRELGRDDSLDGGDVLPGLSISIRRWFDRAGERSPLE